MNQKIRHKKTESDFKNFLEFRKKLSTFDKKLEAVALIDKKELIEVERAWEMVSNKINNNNKIHNIFSSIIKAAAILTLPLLAFTIWSLFFQKQDKPDYQAQNEISWQNIQNPPGMRSQVVLPDGTNLWLNAGSKVRYGIPFAREKREIELTGEAYLEVMKNEIPFFVKTENASVEVLGTQFNIKAYHWLENVEVALKEGRVKFSFTGDHEKIKYCELKANDYLQYGKNSNAVSVNNINIEKYIAWHNNILVLDDTPMKEVARLLEQWYGVKVILKGKEIMSYKFTTTFDNEPLFRVLELLELSSPISIKYIPGKLDKDSKKASQSIVIITKNQVPVN
jgi:transmembrane sensor